MKKLFAMLMVFTLALATSPAWGFSFGTDITVYDGVSVGQSGWYGPQEDNEVAPYMATGQDWDLEGAFLDGKALSLVGGFNFVTGNDGITIGDFFIDSTADAIYGPPAEGSGFGNTDINNSFGWDWVVRLNMARLTYDVLQIDKTAIVNSVLYSQNQESNPVNYVSGGQMISSGIGFNYFSGLTDAKTGFTGGYHNAISGIDLSFLGDDVSFFGHITQSCGNDNVMFAGKITGSPVPEPATMVLFGLGLLGFSMVGRRRKNLTVNYK